MPFQHNSWRRWSGALASLVFAFACEPVVSRLSPLFARRTLTMSAVSEMYIRYHWRAYTRCAAGRYSIATHSFRLLLLGWVRASSEPRVRRHYRRTGLVGQLKGGLLQPIPASSTRARSEVRHACPERPAGNVHGPLVTSELPSARRSAWALVTSSPDESRW